MSAFEDELTSMVEDWVNKLQLDGIEEVASIIAETNSIFSEEYCENIELELLEDGNYQFTAQVSMPHTEPRKDDVMCSSSDRINVKIEGSIEYDEEFNDWDISDDYEVFAGLQRNDDHDYYEDPIDRITTVTYSSATDLIDKLTTFNNVYWFRGHANDDEWKLNSSISREDKPSLMLENSLRLEFENQTAFLDPATYPLEKGACYFLMQHHGLPTRLLDWTKSPLIALFFALEKGKNDHDGAIWVLHPRQLNRLNDETFPIVCTEMHYETKEKGKTIAIHAPYTNLRMKSQQAEFTLHMDYEALEDHPHAHLFLHEKMVIKKEIKAELRKKLTSLGINRTTIYPDLDNIAQTIKENIPPHKGSVHAT